MFLLFSDNALHQYLVLFVSQAVEVEHSLVHQGFGLGLLCCDALAAVAEVGEIVLTLVLLSGREAYFLLFQLCGKGLEVEAVEGMQGGGNQADATRRVPI